MDRLTLPADGLIYLDTDIVIYSVEKIEPYWSLLEPVWLTLQNGNVSVVGSQLLVLETLVKPVQTGDTELEHSFRQLLLHSFEVQLLPIDLTILEQAIRLRAQLNLKTPDAIHAATALTAGCALFLTNDKIFKRIPDLSVTVLSQLLSS